MNILDRILKSICLVRYTKYVADLKEAQKDASDKSRESTQDFMYKQIENKGGRCIVETRRNEIPRIRIVGKA